MKKKKSLTVLEMALVSSLSESYTLLPFMIFSSLLSGEPSTVNFFVPVVILYSIERACIIALRGFGEIKNPYRIMKWGLFIAFLGALIMPLSYLNRAFLVLSALLVGVGLSPLRAMFIPLSECIYKEHEELKKSKRIGIILYLGIMIGVMVLRNTKLLPVVALCFILYISAILWIVFRMDGDHYYLEAKAYDRSKGSSVFFLFGILALLSLIILRQYQMSGVSIFMWMTPVAVIIFLIVEIYRRRNYQDYSFQAYWAGATKSFIMLYSLVFHTSVGNTSMAIFVYVALAFSAFFSDLVKVVMSRYMKQGALTNLSMLLSSFLSILLIFPSEWVNVLGIVISSTFANIVISNVGGKYMKDQRYVKEERALVKIRLLTAGSIIEQLILFFSIYVVGEFGLDMNLLEPYSLGTPNPEIASILRTTGVILYSLLFFSSILIVLFGGRKRRGEN